MYLTPRLYHSFVRPRWFTERYIHHHIRNHFSLEHKTVLDFGCGTGANCRISQAEHYTGIDLDVKRIQFAKQLFPHHTFMVFDGNQIPLPNQRVDFILIVAVLHHIPNELINKYLQEFQRILKPDGNLVIIEPYYCQKHKFSNWFMNRYDDGNYIRNEEDYLRLFINQGFDCRVLKKFRKCFLYNEIFFTAKNG
ncbi:class I SAM-dependent methyltransferase [Paenibacillus sanfengchensis]|uniref:class I SAM-dependent methyltransferase n=1 Tax=Paenibacillus sanfengchensis TaxID=3119819 RepID=UPI003A5C456F